MLFNALKKQEYCHTYKLSTAFWEGKMVWRGKEQTDILKLIDSMINRSTKG